MQPSAHEKLNRSRTVDADLPVSELARAEPVGNFLRVQADAVADLMAGELAALDHSVQGLWGNGRELCQLVD